jgi:hypothetical protein
MAKRHGLPASPDDGKLPCPQGCGKRINSRQMKKHKRTHEATRMTCSKCSSAPLGIGGLRQHERAVHGIPIPCPFEDCDISLSSYYLKRHLKASHGERILCSKGCGKQFTREGSMREHVRQKHTPMYCPICGDIVLTYKLVAHIAANHDCVEDSTLEYADDEDSHGESSFSANDPDVLIAASILIDFS